MFQTKNIYIKFRFSNSWNNSFRYEKQRHHNFCAKRLKIISNLKK